MKNLITTILQTGILATVLVFAPGCEKPVDYNPADIPGDFTPLEKPAAGQGYQIHVPPFPVAPQFEREFFMRVPVGNTEEAYVHAFEAHMRPGTHHMILYSYEDQNEAYEVPELGVMRDQNSPDGRLNLWSNMFWTKMLWGAQSANATITLPPGTAIRIPANATVDVNSHYYNKTDKVRFGEIYANLYTLPKDSVTTVLEQLQLDDYEFQLPPRQEKVVENTFTMKNRTHIYQLTSHTHKLGQRFEIRIVGGHRDGERVYLSEDWEHPREVFFVPELILEKGEGLKSIVTYNNDTDRTIGFGVTSEDEMNIIFGYYYEEK